MSCITWKGIWHATWIFHYQDISFISSKNLFFVFFCIVYGEGQICFVRYSSASGFTNNFYQVRDSPPAMTSPTARTASESCSARGAPRVPSPSQVSKLWSAGHDKQTQLQSIRYTFARSHDACICRHCLFSFKFSPKTAWVNYFYCPFLHFSMLGIGGTRFISFEGRHWHNDCFICSSCKSSMVGKGFITDGEDIICPECAKKKLMADTVEQWWGSMRMMLCIDVCSHIFLK